MLELQCALRGEGTTEVSFIYTFRRIMNTKQKEQQPNAKTISMSLFLAFFNPAYQTTRIPLIGKTSTSLSTSPTSKALPSSHHRHHQSNLTVGQLI